MQEEGGAVRLENVFPLPLPFHLPCHRQGWRRLSRDCGHVAAGARSLLLMLLCIFLRIICALPFFLLVLLLPPHRSCWMQHLGEPRSPSSSPCLPASRSRRALATPCGSSAATTRGREALLCRRVTAETLVSSGVRREWSISSASISAPFVLLQSLRSARAPTRIRAALTSSRRTQ